MTSTTADERFWDRIADSYAAQKVADPAAFERKKAITKSLLTREARVLEVGCGTGTLALEMAAHVARIDAVDSSQAMIAIAERKRSEAGITNVAFHAGTLDGVAALEGQRYDAIFAFSLLHLVPDRAALLADLASRLRPSGVLVSSNVCLGEALVPITPIVAVMRWFGKAPRVHAYDRATLRRELDHAGFVDVEEHDVGAERNIAFVVARRPDAPGGGA